MTRKRQISLAADKYAFWHTLRLLGIEYKRITPSVEFSEWLAQKYGISVDMIDGMYQSSYTIVNEEKHTFFKLKYG